MAIDRIRGAADIPLNAQGKQEIAQVGTHFMRMGKLARVYASDKNRTQETARAIAGGAPIITDPALQDMKYGQLEGQPSKEAIPTINNYIQQHSDQALPGVGPFSGQPGESFDGYKHHLLGSMQEIMKGTGKAESTAAILNRRSIKTIHGWIAAGAQPTHNVDSELATSHDERECPGCVFRIDNHKGKWTMKQLDMDKEKELRAGSVYLVRHGATDWNGESKEPLSTPTITKEPLVQRIKGPNDMIKNASLTSAT